MDFLTDPLKFLHAEAITSLGVLDVCLMLLDPLLLGVERGAELLEALEAGFHLFDARGPDLGQESLHGTLRADTLLQGERTVLITFVACRLQTGDLRGGA